MFCAAELKTTCPTFLFLVSRPLGCRSLSHEPLMTSQLGLGRNVRDLLGICVQGKAFWDLPDSDLKCPVSKPSVLYPRPPYLAIISTRCEQTVVKWAPAALLSRILTSLHRIDQTIPISIQHGSRMSSEERNQIGQLAALADRDNSERAAAARFPVDRDVLGIRLDDVAVPGVLGDAEIVVALFLHRSATVEGCLTELAANLLRRPSEDVS